MAGLQSGESRMMIDSVVWAQYINRHSHVVIANAAPTHCVGRQKHNGIDSPNLADFAKKRRKLYMLPGYMHTRRENAMTPALAKGVTSESPSERQTTTPGTVNVR